MNSVILGKWRHATLVAFSDGKLQAPQENQGDTVFEIRPDGSWLSTSPKHRSSGTYRLLNSDQFEQRIIESNTAALIGTTSIKSIRANTEYLTIIATHRKDDFAKLNDPKKSGKQSPSEAIVISTFVRIAAK